MNFIKKYIKDLLYLSLFAVIILQTCGRYKQTTLPTIKIDTNTIVIKHDSTIVQKPTKTTIINSEKVIEKYYYDTNSNDLKDKYIDLARKFERISTYNQDFKIDTIGSISIKDTISKNEILGRSIKYDIKEKIVTIKQTITLPYKPKRQIYFGGDLQVTPLGINGVSIGGFYKDRRDNVYKITGGLNTTLQPQISIGYYKPIKLK